MSDTLRSRLHARIRADIGASMGTPALLTEREVSSLVRWFLGQELDPYYNGLYRVLEQFRLRNIVELSEIAPRMVEWVCELSLERVEHLKMASGASHVLELPGLGLPLGAIPHRREDRLLPDLPQSEQTRFPILTNLVPDEDIFEWTANTLLNREVCMLRVVEELTNKPDWWTKCYNDEIAERWKKEMMEMDWPAILNLPYADFTPLMADATIAELRRKAPMYARAGLVTVMDYSAAAIKSDEILTDDVMSALKAAVSPLENVPEEQKDWHPGSNGQVLDIVHPSLWPLVYGRSRVVPDKPIDLAEALDHCGTGCVLPKPMSVERTARQQSTRFQWLPCDVTISPEGKASIDSYINSVHPVQHAQLYPVIQDLIEKSLPAWDLVYRWPSEFDCQRLVTHDLSRTCRNEFCQRAGECDETNRPQEPGEGSRDASSDYEGSGPTPIEEKDREWWEDTHRPHNPEPSPDKVIPSISADHVLSSGFFGSTPKIQVIVKLANIHLTPDKPKYEGGSWHVEGMLNEHIVSTALYYYDSENITESHLHFRTNANREDHVNGSLNIAQEDRHAVESVLAIEWWDPCVQDIGAVLTRQGRGLFFPNLYQHRVSPFELVDPSRPGHRKILALFLVDPKIPIISTANVPPQQQHWWRDTTRELSEEDILAADLKEKLVVGEKDGMMGLEEAKEIREELMKERSVANTEMNQEFAKKTFHFCEH